VTTINHEEKVKERWAGNYENFINRDRDIEENNKFVTPWMRKKIYFVTKN
jgi:hypothetical protein